MGIKVRKSKELIALRDKFKKLVTNITSTIGNIAVEYYKDSFRHSGFRDEVFFAWKKRSKKSKRNNGRAILVDTGALRRSIRILVLRKNKVRVGTIGIPYAEVHNEGFVGNVYVKPHKRTHWKTKKRFNVKGFGKKVRMPQRKFIGESKFLNRYIEIKIANQIKKTLR